MITVDRAQQFGDLLRIGERGHVLLLNRRQRAAEVSGYVTLRASGRHGIPAYLADVGIEAMGSLERAALFNSAQRIKHVWRREFGNWFAADPRERVDLKPKEQAGAVAGGPARRILRVPFPGDCLERIFSAQPGGSLLCFLGLAAGVQQRTRLVAPFAHLFQGHIRVGAQGDPLLLAAEAILEPPPLAPAGGQLPDTGRRRRTGALACRLVWRS